MVVDLLLAGAIFSLAGVMMITRGNFKITIVHQEHPENIKKELVSMREEMMEELSEKDNEIYTEADNLIGALNQMIYGDGDLEEMIDGEEKTK